MAQLPVAQQVGGYQMPSIGVIGGLAGVGGAASVAAAKASTKVGCILHANDVSTG